MEALTQSTTTSKYKSKTYIHIPTTYFPVRLISSFIRVLSTADITIILSYRLLDHLT